MHKTHQHLGEELSGVSSHHAYKAGHDTLEDRLAFWNRRGRRRGKKMRFWMLPIPGQNRLTVVMDQRKVEILEGTKLKKELVFFLDAKFLPLVGLNLMNKTATGVVRNFFQKRGKGVGGGQIHNNILWVKECKGQHEDEVKVGGQEWPPYRGAWCRAPILGAENQCK